MNQGRARPRLAAIVDRRSVTNFQIFEFGLKTRLCAPERIIHLCRIFQGQAFFCPNYIWRQKKPVNIPPKRSHCHFKFSLRLSNTCLSEKGFKTELCKLQIPSGTCEIIISPYSIVKNCIHRLQDCRAALTAILLTLI